MPDKNFKEMATKFMDAWQKQVEMMMRDPSFILESLNSMQKMQENFLNAQNFAENIAKTAGKGNNPWQAGFGNLYGSEKDGKTSSSNSDKRRDDDITQLAIRTQNIEQRLARIEEIFTAAFQPNKTFEGKPKRAAVTRNKKTSRRKK